MKPNYLSACLSAVGTAAALIMATGCSDPHATSGNPVPAPTGSTEAAGKGAAPEQDADTTEFAALDTNSNGTLEPAEWESPEVRELSNLKNMTFAQLDRNSSGGLEPEEFRNARTSGDVRSDLGGGAEGNADIGADAAIRQPETEPEAPQTGTDAEP